MTFLLAVLGALYFRGWYKLRRDLPRVIPAWRLAAFLGGVAAAWIAVASPAAHLDHHLLTAHMAKHLLLMLVAAPLILLGGPVIVLMHVVPQVWIRGASRLHSLGSVCSHPVFCWLAGTVTVIVWHVPAAFELALGSPWWHNVEQASFYVAGSLFWWPVIRP